MLKYPGEIMAELVPMEPRFQAVPCSVTNHCCFEASVVDTNHVSSRTRDGKAVYYEAVCECCELADAQRIADALNAATHEEPDAILRAGAVYRNGPEYREVLYVSPMGVAYRLTSLVQRSQNIPHSGVIFQCRLDEWNEWRRHAELVEP